jgi:hypothetical protein
MLWVVCLLSICQLSVVRADEVVKLRTRPGIAGWAVDEDSGHLFAALTAENAIIRYDLDGKAKQLFIDENPVWLTVKKKQLFVVNEDGSIECFAIKPSALDKLSFRDIGSRIDLPPIYSNSNQPFLYFIDRNANILKFDVGRKVVVRSEPFQTNDRMKIQASRRDSITLSPDEKSMFLASSDGELFDLDETTLTVTRNKKFRGSRASRRGFICYFDQTGRYLSLDSGLMRMSDLAKIEFLGSSVQVHPDYDLAVSLGAPDSNGKFRVFFQRFSDRKLLKIVQLVGSPTGKSSPRDTSKQSLISFSANDRMWLAIDDEAWLFSLDRLALTQRKTLDVDLPNLRIINGNNFAIDLTDKVPEGEKEVSWELLKSPKGMALDGDSLNWNPTEDQSGSFDVKLRLTAGNRSIVKSFRVSIVADSAPIDMGGAVAKVRVNFAGDVALCRTDTRGINRYVAVNLDSGKVLSSTEIDVQIRDIVLTDNYVYYVENERDWILIRRPFDNLEKEESEDLLTKIHSLEYFSNEELALTMEEPKALFRIPADEAKIPNRDKFKPGVLVSTNRMGSSPRLDFRSRSSHPSISQFSEQFFYANGIIRAAATGTPSTIIDNISLPIYVDEDAKKTYRYRDVSPMPLPFGNMINYEASGTGSSKKSTIFAGSPFSARLSRTRLEPNTLRTRSLSQFMPVTFSCILTETSLSVVAYSNVGNQRVASSELESGVYELSALKTVPIPFKDGLLIPFENRIYLYRLSEEHKAKLRQPLQIGFPKHTEITASTRESIQLQTVGGVGDITFKKLNSGEAMLLNEETGEIVIDSTKLVIGYNPLKTTPNAVNDPVAMAPLKTYNALFGTQHKPTSELGLYPVSVEARDSIGQRTMISFFVAISKLQSSGFDQGKLAVAIPPPQPGNSKPEAPKQPAPVQNDGVASNMKNEGDVVEQEKRIESLESTSKSIEQQLKGIEALLKQDAKTEGKKK